MELVTAPPAIASALAPELATYCSDTGASVLPVPVGTLQNYQAAIAGATFDSLFVLDQEPTDLYLDSPDGHPNRLLPHDPHLKPGVPVGRLDLSRLAGVDPIGAYRAYFGRLHDYHVNGAAVPLISRIFDNFSNTLPGIGQAIKQQFAALPGSLIDYHDNAEISRASPYGPGPALTCGPCMFHVDDSGGMDYEWLWDEGREPDFVSHPIRALFAGIFGSYMVDSQQDNSLFRSLMTWALFAVYDYYGQFPWSAFLTGKTIGQVALAYNLPWTCLMGSPSIRLEQSLVDTIAVLKPYDDRLTALEQAVAGMQAAVPLALPLIINCGPGDKYGVSGLVWPSLPPVDTSGVVNPLPTGDYSSGRGGPAAAIVVPGIGAGKLLKVRLHLAEPNVNNTAGKRLFDVSANGAVIISRLDIFARAGAINKATVAEFSAAADAAGSLRLDFTVSAGSADPNAYVCGVEIDAA